MVVAGPHLVAVDAEVICEFKFGLVAVAGDIHEDIDCFVADWHPADLDKAKRFVEGNRTVDVGDSVTGVKESHGPQSNDHCDGVLASARIEPMIIERAMDPQFLSNTYLVADDPGETAVLIDAGGPVEPLLNAIDRGGYTLSHILLTHHHYDHVSELDKVLERFPATPVLIHPGEREHVGQVTGDLNPGDVIVAGGLRIEALHTPGHTNGMLAFVVNGSDVFTGDTLFKGSVGGVSATGSTSYSDLKSSVMDVLMALDPATVVHPGHTDPTTIGDEFEHNGFIRIWRGLDPEGTGSCLAMGEPATLILLGDDYDGGHKAWVRWPDGRDDIVAGSKITVVADAEA